MQKHIVLYPLLFAAIHMKAQLPSVQEVYQVFQAKCISCHDHASPEGGLDLEGSGATAYLRAVNVAQNLTNVNPSNAYALDKGLKRVYPGRPDRSFLFRKINGGFEPTIAALHQDEGAAMPNYPGTPLTDAEKEIVRQWILYGAKTAGVQFNKPVVEAFYNTGGEKSFPDGPPPAPAPGEGFQIKMGPFYLAPGTEVEYYQKYELELPADVEVNRLALQMSGYSHHFIVYNFTGNGDDAVPHGLRLDANHNDINLVAAVQEQTDLKLPATTAFRWGNDIVLDLNSHYINYSAAFPYQCEAYLNVYTQPSGTAEQEMFAALLVNPFIPIPNNGNVITHTKPEFQFGADSIYVWGLMGHTHKYGRSYKVWKRLPNGQKGEMIYNASCPFGIPGCSSQYFDYRHIPLRYWEPLLPIKWGDGIIHEASWVNEGPVAVNFGPTSDDEMMVLIAFYTLDPVTVGAAEPESEVAEKQILVVPNPAYGSAAFYLPGVSEVRQFRLFDLAGREVLRRDGIAGNSFEIGLGDLSPGIYLFHADGRTGKLVVE
ncbi:MAG: T9SS C-terminal target domain-containing protein [Haliscomenobacteraceae bacterium CHB4]|nr:T9SS C-terminal target domain-containing protein [Haliscomenobacteraceae bacterium CHB4]